MASYRYLNDGELIPHGTYMVKAYTVDFAAVGTPTSPTSHLYDEADNSDQSTLLSSTASVASTSITSQKVGALTPGNTYRLHFRFTLSGNTEDYVLRLKGEY